MIKNKTEHTIHLINFFGNEIKKQKNFKHVNQITQRVEVKYGEKKINFDIFLCDSPIKNKYIKRIKCKCLTLQRAGMIVHFL